MRWLIPGGLVLALLVSRAEAQVVQLPTFNFTTVNTTVSVPDQGEVLLGGIKRSQEGRNQLGVPGLPFRPFNNVGIGRSTGAGNMSVRATIHDFEAMDAALLGQAAAARGGGPSLFEQQQMSTVAEQQRRAYLDRVAAQAGPQRAAPPERTVADVIRDREAERAAEQLAAREKWADFLARGRAAEEQGKVAAARIYYRTVVRNAGGELKAAGEARLAALDGPQVESLARDR